MAMARWTQLVMLIIYCIYICIYLISSLTFPLDVTKYVANLKYPILGVKILNQADSIHLLFNTMCFGTAYGQIKMSR